MIYQRDVVSLGSRMSEAFLGWCFAPSVHWLTRRLAFLRPPPPPLPHPHSHLRPCLLSLPPPPRRRRLGHRRTRLRRRPCVPESTIASHGRWKSLAYRSYFDVQFNLQLRLAATAQLSLYDSRRLGQEPSL